MKLNKFFLTIGVVTLALAGFAQAQSQQFWMMKAVPTLKPNGTGNSSPSIKLNSSILPEGMPGKNYSFDLKTLTQVSAGPGISSVEYGMGGGDLPAGISLSNDGILSGKPTASNLPNGSNFTVAATYSGKNASQAYTVKIGDSVLSATKVVVGAGFSCALTGEGSVKCWGTNTNSQLGRGKSTYVPETTPKSVIGLDSGVTDISAGSTHVCAIKNGAVLCWGSNTSGQIGNGFTATATSPAKVTGIDNASAISAGSSHTCAIESGAAKCWGSNSDGKLGDGSAATRQLTPVQVFGLSGVTSISSGSNITCAVAAGAAKCWGYGNLLGNKTGINSSIPVQVDGLDSGVVSVAAGAGHGCALLADSTAKCWGTNSFGQLGNGESSGQFVLSPAWVQSSGIVAKGFKSIFVGASHSCGIISGGNVQCWGGNGSGRFGNGSATGSLTPVNIIATHVTSLDIDSDHSCAVADGLAQCWGSNYSGYLGIGNTDSPKYSPQKVLYGE